MNNKATGKMGESFVCRHLLNKGYQIVDRNFLINRYSEIDIIAKKSTEIAFIEVKTRTSFKLGEQYKAVTNYKSHKIKRGVSHFLNRYPKYYEFSYKLVVAIVLIDPYSKRFKVVFYDYLH